MAKAKEAKIKNSSKTSTPTYHNYIGGDWVKSSSGEWFDNVNPADTSDIVGRFPQSNAEDVNKAVEAAKNAATKWRRTPAPKRAELLFTLGEILREHKDQYTRDMTREMGKVLKEAGGDVQEAIDCTYYTAGEGRRLHGFTTPA
ncbi:MAG: aldehyde dehydrogenase family protein, partial [Blastocatellia bacterium]|nr:aldehyde dehydrogenase family protein [Blastocatellia bacterium]